MSAPTARLLFRIAALFNAGAVLLFLPVLGLADHAGLEGAPTGTTFEYVGIAAVGIFGVGYWIAAAAPERHRDIVWLGLAGKVLAVSIVISNLVEGDVNGRLAAVVAGDIVFCVLFTWYLASNRPATDTSAPAPSTAAQRSARA